MKAEIIAHIEKCADNDYERWLCHCDKEEGKLIYARRLQFRAGKTVEAILDGVK